MTRSCSGGELEILTDQIRRRYQYANCSFKCGVRDCVPERTGNSGL